jgi:hypothetical protein
MVDRLSRNKLAEALRHLVSGQLSTDRFTDTYPKNTTDAAVSAIWEWAWGLFSDGLYSYRLRGRHKVSPETRRDAARAVVFLHSDVEYEWPPGPDWKLGAALAGGLSYLGILFSIACLVIACLALLGKMWDAFLIAIVPAVVVLLPSLILRSHLKRGDLRRWESFKKAGDYDVWPFLRRDDLEIAIRKPRLLAGTGDRSADARSDQ